MKARIDSPAGDEGMNGCSGDEGTARPKSGTRDSDSDKVTHGGLLGSSSMMVRGGGFNECEAEGGVWCWLEGQEGCVGGGVLFAECWRGGDT